MKYLLVLAVVWVAYWVWRKNRLDDKTQAKRSPPPRPPAAPQLPTVMVACLHCGTHLPESEAVQGRQGVYCSPEHQQLSEGAGP
ncbi:MAG: PP0621 family protein [Hydrogenophaga sp.]|uniref:PP0621 family protein n=1 Tax=Hydrogenophaga sp. TaxID=1904254 RepID=UPI00276EAEE1|nr:PP0621 family protein [Hydrogenophaga sp.]MDP2417629.1 PP0621 family protein [Hydrogenophaga sp.]MDZ4189405.1 PP0621 family protein [Hydrogenophaga sp.]